MTQAHFEIEKLKHEINTLVSEYGFDPYDDEDADLWLDTLEGETTIEEVLQRLLELRFDAKADEEMVKDRIANLRARQDRHKRTQEAMTKAMMYVLRLAGIKSYKGVEATWSLRPGRQSVVIEDEAAIPSQLCKVTTTPDKVAITNALKNNDIVPGAVLVDGDETLSVKTN